VRERRGEEGVKERRGEEGVKERRGEEGVKERRGEEGDKGEVRKRRAIIVLGGAGGQGCVRVGKGT
jgi:hypothetical protein